MGPRVADSLSIQASLSPNKSTGDTQEFIYQPYKVRHLLRRAGAQIEHKKERKEDRKKDRKKEWTFLHCLCFSPASRFLPWPPALTSHISGCTNCILSASKLLLAVVFIRVIKRKPEQRGRQNFLVLLFLFDFLQYFFCGRASSIPGWPWFRYVAKGRLELLKLLSLPP